MTASECISRENAINALDELCDRVCQYSKKQRSVMCGACPLGSAFDTIEELPAADVRPVVRAHWDDVDVSFIDSQNTVGLHAIASMFCPVCERYHNEAYWYGDPTEGVNFCPNCGAEMEVTD